MKKKEKGEKSPKEGEFTRSGVQDVLERHQINLDEEGIDESTASFRIQNIFNLVFRGKNKDDTDSENSNEGELVSKKREDESQEQEETSAEDLKSTVIFDITKLSGETKSESHELDDLDISFTVNENAQNEKIESNSNKGDEKVPEPAKDLDEVKVNINEGEDDDLSIESHSFKDDSSEITVNPNDEKKKEENIAQSNEISDGQEDEEVSLLLKIDKLSIDESDEISKDNSTEDISPEIDDINEEQSASELVFNSEENVDVSFVNKHDDLSNEVEEKEISSDFDNQGLDLGEFPNDEDVVAQSFEEEMTQTLSFVKSDLPEDSDEDALEENLVSDSKEIREGYNSFSESNINRDDFKNYYTDEMIKLQSTLKNLRLERKDLLNEIEKLEARDLKITQENLNLTAKVEEMKIEINIMRRKHEEEIDLLKYRLNVADETKMMVQEKLESLKLELNIVNKKTRVDVNKVRSREKELESQIEMLREDTAAQISTRDKKIIDLKKEIDILKFDMEGMEIKEKEMKVDEQDKREKIDKITLALKTTLGMLENSEFDDERKEILKKLRL